MFNHTLIKKFSRNDFTLTCLNMTYIAMVISSIVLFELILKLNLFGIHIELPGGVVPYVFLYPISFIILRVYGIENVNITIGATILVAFIFVTMAKLIALLSPENTTINHILSSSYKMYLVGFIGMPAGMYTSFLTINLLNKIGFSFNGISLSIATAAGELVNTLIVFPIGLHGSVSTYQIFHEIVADALLFKFIAGTILAFMSIIIINVTINSKVTNL